MLVLGRRPNESIFMGRNNEIKITIVKSSKGQVRLAIEAPKDMPIYREEVLARIQGKPNKAKKQDQDQY